MMNSDPTPLGKSLDAMLKLLKRYAEPPLLSVPPPPPLTPPSVVLTSVVERTVGLGSRVGTDMRGPLSVAALKGLRVEAVVRYEVWEHTPADVGQAIEILVKNLLGDRERLRAAGFLRLALKSTGPSENVFAEDAWRQNVEFGVLFEFPYVDSDEADSLIAQIPIRINSEINELTTVVDEMARWDNLAAPALLLRGPLSISRFSALTFMPGAAATGKVTLTRTFDGALGPTTVHPDLPTFLAAVADPDHPAVEGQVVFASLTDFLSVFTPDGDPITLGDWDEDLVADDYHASTLTIAPPIKLPRVNDRFEISYETSAFDQVAVVYLRAT